MKPQDAKVILATVRTGTNQVLDPDEVTALELVRNDAALREWFDRHAAFQSQLRESFRQIPVPEGLADRLLTESKIIRLDVGWRRTALWSAAAAVLLLGFVAFWLRPPAEATLANFRSRMVGAALRQYGMDIATNSMAPIRQFLAKNRAPSDYRFPPTLARLAPVGAGLLSWQGEPVSMVCLKSIRQETLYVFMVDRAAVKSVLSASPEFAQVNKLLTATWSDAERVYVLASPEDLETLRSYF